MRLLLPIVLLLAGCGGTTRVGFLFNPGSASVNGVVSFVHISVIGNADGTQVTVTGVTLVNAGLASSLNFCGDHAIEFPLNTAVTATFNPGSSCSMLVSVQGAGGAHRP